MDFLCVDLFAFFSATPWFSSFQDSLEFFVDYYFSFYVNLNLIIHLQYKVSEFALFELVEKEKHEGP